MMFYTNIIILIVDLPIRIILPIANIFCGYILKHISFNVRFHDPGLIMQ